MENKEELKIDKNGLNLDIRKVRFITLRNLITLGFNSNSNYQKTHM